MDLTYRVEKLKSGGFVAFCPTMKPVRVFGKTEDDASKKLISTAKLYLKRHPDFLDTIRTSSLED